MANVLRELQTPELQIIFSSDLVPASLLVKAEPKPAPPRSIAQQILAPHGLALVPGPRGRLLVVPVNRAPLPLSASELPPPAEDRQAPTSTSRETEEIRIEERVEVTDRIDDTSGKPDVYTVQPLTILDTAGSLDDVRRTLQMMPGVAATNDRDGKMAVRGAGPEHNVIMLDGVQIHNPNRLGEFTSSFLNPAIAASVSLDASGLEARHGGRLSSVTVIETRDGRTDRRLAFSGSLGLTSADVLVEGRLPNTETGSWWAGARGTYYQALVNRFGDAVPGFGDAQFKVSVRPTRRTRLAAFALLGRETALESPSASEVGNTGGGSTIGSSNGSPPSTSPVSTPNSAVTQYGGINRLAATTLWWTPGPTLATTTTVSAYGHVARDYDGSLVIAGIPPFRRDVRVNDLAFRHRIEHVPSRGHLLDAGVETHRITSSWLMANVKQLDAWRGLGPSTGGELVNYSAGPVQTHLARTQVGGWIQYRLPLGSIFSTEPGTRVEWNSLTRETSVQPRVRIAARAGRTTVWAGFAVQAQTPSHESLLGFDYYHLTPVAGARLRNEQSRQVVAGLDRTFGAGLSLRVEAYRRRFDRLLVQSLETDAERAARLAVYEIPPDLPPDHVVLEYRPTANADSIGRGTASGVEVLVLRNGRRASGSLAYTFSKATREMYGLTFPFDFDRPHAITATAGVQVIRQVRVSATWQRTSGFPITPVLEEVRFTRAISRDGTVDPIFRVSRVAGGTFIKSPSPAMRRLALRNSQRLNGYARADLRGTYSTGGPWEIYAEVLNVFNRWNYVEKIQYTSGLGGLVSENNVYAQFERLPSFGVRVKF